MTAAHVLLPWVAMTGLSSLAHAHGNGGHEAIDWSAVDPAGAVLLLVVAWLYGRGTRMLTRTRGETRVRSRQVSCFWSGWLTLAVAFGPPLEALTAVSFAAHMVQHELLMLAAAPLLVVARPLGVMMWGLPDRARRWCAGVSSSGALRAAVRVLAAPLAAWVLHLVALWAWHVPAAFELAVRNDAVHWAQHATFFAAAVFFWHSVFRAGRAGSRRGVAIISMFATAVHTTVLGALLTFAATPWYAPYRSTAPALGMTAVEDQQLGGLIMWVPGGLVFVLAALAIAAAWLDETSRGEGAEPPAQRSNVIH